MDSGGVMGEPVPKENGRKNVDQERELENSNILLCEAEEELPPLTLERLADGVAEWVEPDDPPELKDYLKAVCQAARGWWTLGRPDRDTAYDFLIDFVEELREKLKEPGRSFPTKSHVLKFAHKRWVWRSVDKSRRPKNRIEYIPYDENVNPEEKEALGIYTADDLTGNTQSSANSPLSASPDALVREEDAWESIVALSEKHHTEREFAVWIMRAIHEEEYYEIADELGITVVNARQIFDRARGKFDQHKESLLELFYGKD